MSNQARIGPLLLKLRKSRGLTQEQIAEKLGIHPTGVGRRETDDYNPQWDTLMEHLAALGYGVEALCSWGEAREPSEEARDPGAGRALGESAAETLERLHVQRQISRMGEYLLELGEKVQRIEERGRQPGAGGGKPRRGR